MLHIINNDDRQLLNSFFLNVHIDDSVAIVEGCVNEKTIKAILESGKVKKTYLVVNSSSKNKHSEIIQDAILNVINYDAFVELCIECSPSLTW